MPTLASDLESPEFLHGVVNGLWALCEQHGDELLMTVTARDGVQWAIRLNCAGYWEDAILGRFVDRTTGLDTKDAWPRGSGAFEQWVKFNAADNERFICSDIDRGGLTHHPDWRGRRAWQVKPNQLVSYLDFVSRLLRLPDRGYQAPEATKLTLSRDFYATLMQGLRARGADGCEAAAVIAGSVDARNLYGQLLVWFDELEEDASASYGHVWMSEHAKLRLYERVSASGLSIVATVHTHPGRWVGLSAIDRENQISGRIGVWSLIVPHFAAHDAVDPITCGAHIRMRRGWLSLTPAEISQQLVLSP